MIFGQDAAKKHSKERASETQAKTIKRMAIEFMIAMFPEEKRFCFLPAPFA